ncbi:hypothetical protein ASF23_05435 [Curtobacterium sp. Leaf261]|nr:hypothetical protein ASF23_05435 [Curtobacterium sp. Leaf261]
MPRSGSSRGMTTARGRRTPRPDRTPRAVRAPRVVVTPRLVFVVALLGLFLVSAAWSLASPLSSGPDESGHVAKAAATVRGQFVGAPTDTPGITTFRLPADIGQVGGEMTCYVALPMTTASCAPAPASLGHEVQTVKTGVGSYYPLYYAVVGWPSLIVGGSWSMLGMRLVSALVNSFFLALVLFAAASLPRLRTLAGWFAVACTPMVFYLGGLVNPNGTEICATAAATALGLLVLHDSRERPSAGRMALLAVSIAVAASMRSTSPVILVIVLVAVCLTVPVARLVSVLRTRAVLVAIAATVVAILPAVVWTMSIARDGGFIPSSDPERAGVLAAATHTFLDTGTFGKGMIGIFGWQDTFAPEAVYAGWTIGLGIVVFGALAAGRRRAMLGALVLMAAVVLFPVALQAPTAHTFGYIWQGRYGLPVLVAMVLVAGFAAGSSSRGRTGGRAAAVLVGAAAVGQVLSFVAVYRRYSVGSMGSRGAMFSGDGWQAPGGVWTVGTMLVIGLVVLGAVVITIASARRSPSPSQPALSPSQPAPSQPAVSE